MWLTIKDVRNIIGLILVTCRHILTEDLQMSWIDSKLVFGLLNETFLCARHRDRSVFSKIRKKSLHENPDKEPKIRGFCEDSSESQVVLDSITEQSSRYT